MKELVIMVALGMAATAAFAEQNKMNFGEVDSNKDGAITREEAASFAALEQRFEKMDANSNGLIEKQEFGADAAPTAADKTAD